MIQAFSINIQTYGEKLYEITDEVISKLREIDFDSGHCNLFIQHTSASLLIQENADPSAKYDLEKWISRFIPINDPNYTHVDEGPDDMPSHIKSAITQTSITIPFIDGELMLGTWQGIYLWEHRTARHQRRILVSFVG